MIKRIVAFIFLFSFPYYSWSQADGNISEFTRDPFKSLILKEKKRQKFFIEQEQKKSSAVQERPQVVYSQEPLPLDINIEGIIWGTEMPQAIINGEIYREGEQIKGLGVKIIKISKGSVSLYYQGVIYEKTVTNVKNREE